jgi:hypothetical protein
MGANSQLGSLVSARDPKPLDMFTMRPAADFRSSSSSALVDSHGAEHIGLVRAPKHLHVQLARRRVIDEDARVIDENVEPAELVLNPACRLIGGVLASHVEPYTVGANAFGLQILGGLLSSSLVARPDEDGHPLPAQLACDL